MLGVEENSWNPLSKRRNSFQKLPAGLQKAEDEDAKRRRKGDFFKREEPGETVETREESKARQLKNAHGWLRDLPERTTITQCKRFYRTLFLGHILFLERQATRLLR